MEQDKKTINIPYDEFVELQRCSDIIRSNEIRIILGDRLRRRILIEGINKDTIDADAPDVFNKFINIIKEECKECSDETDKLETTREEREAYDRLICEKEYIENERVRLNNRSFDIQREIFDIRNEAEKKIIKTNSLYKTYKALFWCTSIVFAITVYNLL